jgi:hypothetical protein
MEDSDRKPIIDEEERHTNSCKRVEIICRKATPSGLVMAGMRASPGAITSRDGSEDVDGGWMDMVVSDYR